MTSRMSFLACLCLLLSSPALSQTGPSPGGDFPLMAAIDSSGAVNLSWHTPMHAQAQAFVLYRAALTDPTIPPDSGDFTFVDSLASSDSVYIDRPVDSAAAFAYVMHARLLSGSIRSNVVIVPGRFMHSGPPIHLTARINTVSASPLFTVDLSWSVRDDLDARLFILKRAAITYEQDLTRLQFIAIDTVTGSLTAVDTPPVQQAPGFAYLIETVTSSGTSVRSNIALVYYRAQYGFPMSAQVQDSGTVRLVWFPLQDSLSVDMFLIRRGAGETTSHGAPPAVIDSVSGVNEYTDHPPIRDDGGSFVYMITARLASGVMIHSSPAAVYFRPRQPQTAFRLAAAVIPPDTIRMVWDEPLNVSVLKYYILAYFTGDQVPAMNPSGLRVIDSTISREYRFVAPSTARYGIVAVTALSSAGRLIPSNGVPIEIPGRRLDPPRLSGDVTDTGTVLLSIFRPASISGSMAYIYRNVVDTPGVYTFAYPWVLIDSTTADQYVDSPPAAEMGVVYSVRVRVSGIRLESNPYFAIIQERVYLQVFPDLDGAIRLEWTPVLRSPAEWYVVERQTLTDSTLTDSTLTVGQDAGRSIDTVRGLHYRDRPNDPEARGYAYRVTAMRPEGPLQSHWRVIRWDKPLLQPFYLTARTTVDGQVALNWTAPFQVPPRIVRIYRAGLDHQDGRIDTTKLALIDSVEGIVSSYKDTPPLAASRAFLYKVVAVASAPILFSNPVAVLFPSYQPRTGAVKITSEPVRSGVVGVPYAYQPTAESTDPGALFTWSLVHSPQGMTIDSVTGAIDWLPFSRGLFRVVLAARTEQGSKTIQEYSLAIAAGIGTVSGTVYDPTGRSLPHVMIRLLKRDAQTPFEYVQRTDSTGAYTFENVETGSYAAHALDLTGTHASEWWYDKQVATEADKVVVAEGAEATVNFILEPRVDQAQLLTVQGTVRDTNALPLRNASVVFARAEYLLNSAKHLGTGILRGENVRDLLAGQDMAYQPDLTGVVRQAEPVVTAFTDASGSYSLHLSPGSYIALSYADGFRKIFFDGQTNPLQADILRIGADTSGIDFSLTPLPNVPLSTLSGSVYDTSGSSGVPSRIIAFRLTGNMQQLDSYYTDADASGAYVLADIPPGAYIMLAVPLGHSVPSFYALEGTTFSWLHASRIQVDGANLSGLDIFVRPTARTVSGFTSIEGTVTDGSRLGRTTGASLLAAVDGSIVYATNEDGSVAGYAVTDATGSYSIMDLPPGTYTVTADGIGYAEPTSVAVTPTYDANGDPVSGEANFTVVLQTTRVPVTQPKVPSEYRLAQNFPNPFNPITTISFSVPLADWVTIDVFNILGQKVANLVDGVFPAGTHSTTWNGITSDGTAAPTGVYFYALRSSTFTSTRRMVLLR